MKIIVRFLIVIVLLAGGVAGYLLTRPAPPERSDFDAAAVETTEYCQPDSDNVWPKGLGEVKMGKTEQFVWAEGGGCVHRPIRDIVGIVHNAPFMAGYNEGGGKGGSVVGYEIRPLGAKDKVSHHFEIDMVVENPLTNTTLTVDWQQEIIAGSADDPREVVISYRYLGGAKPFLNYWEGRFKIKRLTDEITAVFIHDEIQGVTQNEAFAKGTVDGFFEKLSRGTPDFEQMAKHTKKGDAQPSP